MGIQIPGKSQRRNRASTKARRHERRALYIEKVTAQDFDSFNTDDLKEFYSDLYKIHWGRNWVHESMTLCNMVFGRLLMWYGPRESMNFIAASFQTRNPPKSVVWYNGAGARALVGDYYDHCLKASREMIEQWRSGNPIEGTAEEINGT